MKRLVSNLSKQDGVIIPILAVMFMAVFLALVVLGLDARMVSDETSLLRAKTQEICSGLVAEAPFQAKALDMFVRGINAFATSLNPSTELLQAKLTIPTMSESFGFLTGFNKTEQTAFYTSSLPSSAPALSTTIPNNNDYDICHDPSGSIPPPSSCQGSGICQNSAVCLFNPNVYFAATGELPDPNSANSALVTMSIEDRFPPNLMANLYNAGNTAICELSARVSTTFSGRKVISAKAAWRIAAKSKSPLPGNNGVPPFQFSLVRLASAGLSIAVAPHMTTWSFPAASTPGRPDNRFEFQNPTLNTVNPLINIPNTFNADSSSHTIPAGGPSTTVMVDPANADDRDDLRVACMNPAVLVRNLFLSTILEYISRHAEFRTMTELMVVGTQHQNVANANTTHIVANYPTVIVPFRWDLAAPHFQLPYVSFFGGASGFTNGVTQLGSIPNEFGPPVTDVSSNGRFVSGFINPLADYVTATSDYFIGSAFNDSQRRQYHALIANQLRMCAHLYQGTALAGINRDIPPFSYDAAFAPASVQPNFFAPMPLLRNSYLGANDIWDQPCPWSQPAGDRNFGTHIAPYAPSCTESYFNSYQSRFFTAAEIASTLGTVQRCTIDGYLTGESSTTCDRTGYIARSAPVTGNASGATFDLRPDILGTLRYITNANIDLLNPYSDPLIGSSPPTNSPAVESPGYFRPVTANPGGPPNYSAISGLADLRFPYGTSPGRYISGNAAIYLPGHPDLSPILLVMHQRLNDLDFAGNPSCPGSCSCNNPQSETCRIRCFVQSSAFTPSNVNGDTYTRPITILYFPTTTADASDTAIRNILCAFDAIESPGADDPRNGLFVYSPAGGVGNPGFPGYVPGGCGAPLTSACNFRQFWEWLLTQPATAPASVHGLARDLIDNRLISKGILF